MLWQELMDADCKEDEINKMTYSNVADWYGIDLFKHIPKEQATVGALRALAGDVETSITPKAEWRRRFEAKHSA